MLIARVLLRRWKSRIHAPAKEKKSFLLEFDRTTKKNMNIRLADQHDKKAWDTYINSRPDAAPYSLYAWKEAVEDAYGHKACYLLAEEDGKIQGVLPLVHFRIPLRSRNLVSLPYCDIGDILADTKEISRLLAEEALLLTEQMKVDGLDIRSCTEQLIDAGSEWKVDIQTGKVRMLMDLPDSSEELWKSFKSKLRSQVNKAEKNGLTFCWGAEKDLDDFYQVFSSNMHALGSPVHSKQWIEKILEYYGENARMGLIFKDGLPVGCGIILFTKHRVSIPWASTLREFNRLSPNMMLYWNFLKFAADHKKQVFDFGRSTLNEGTFRFKKQWGAAPEPLYWYRVTPTDNSQESEKNTPVKREKLAGLWSKMPLSVANALGPKIRKYISL